MRLGILIALLAAGTASAQDSAGSVARSCRKAFQGLSKHGIVSSFVAMDARTGDVIAEHGARRLLVPASNMKVLTAAAALLGAGPDHLILTDLVLHGVSRGGDLYGSLRLRGEGDPTLRAKEVLPALVSRVRAKGIRRVRGDLLVDDRLLTGCSTAQPGPTTARPGGTWPRSLRFLLTRERCSYGSPEANGKARLRGSRCCPRAR